MRQSVLMSLVLSFGCGTLPKMESPQEVPRSPSLAQSVEAEEERLVQDHNATRVDILVLDVETRALLAQAHRGPEGEVEIASTLKPLTVGAALSAGLDPAHRFTGEDGH